VAELEEDVAAYERQVAQLKSRNAMLLERERRRQGA
jgi:cell division protein FtsB